MCRTKPCELAVWKFACGHTIQVCDLCVISVILIHKGHMSWCLNDILYLYIQEYLSLAEMSHLRIATDYRAMLASL